MLQHGQTVAALQYAFKGRSLAAGNHNVVVYAAERRAPMHRTGTKQVVECLMSALGQKQTFAPQTVMSALPPKSGY